MNFSERSSNSDRRDKELEIPGYALGAFKYKPRVEES
jgi:hypothetical protein